MEKTGPSDQLRRTLVFDAKNAAVLLSRKLGLQATSSTEGFSATTQPARGQSQSESQSESQGDAPVAERKGFGSQLKTHPKSRERESGTLDPKNPPDPVDVSVFLKQSDMKRHVRRPQFTSSLDRLTGVLVPRPSLTLCGLHNGM